MNTVALTGLQRRMAGVVLGLAVVGVGAADVLGQDKSGYTLFEPTPADRMRELSADRPDGTESPYTVDAGHYQVELSFAGYTYNDDDGVKTDSLTVLDTNLKAGLTNNIDLQVVFGVYEREATDPSGGAETTDEGFGDLQLRLKINVWGNDGGQTAFGVMPFIKVPLGGEVSNDHVEGGVAHMLSWNVAEDWGLGFMAEFDAVYDDGDGDYDLEFIHTVVLGFDVAGPVGAYVEYIGLLSSEGGGDYQAIFSTGVTYGVDDNLVLDVGTQVGLTDAADDVNVFAGVTWRF